MSKLYLPGWDEFVYTRKGIIDGMEKEGITELEVSEAVRMVGSGLFFCTKLDVVGEVSESGCGKLCNEYQPRNGKNGRCRFSGPVYEHGEKVTIKRKENSKKV